MFLDINGLFSVSYVLYKWNFVHEKCEVMEGIMCSGCFSIYIPKTCISVCNILVKSTN